MTYTTYTEAQNAIIEAIEAGGAAKAEEYDIEAISDKLIVCDYTTTPKYELVEDEDLFWATVAEYAL